MSATAERRQLSYPNINAVIDDVQLLRTGYVKIGNWDLPQMCWHLTMAIEKTGRPAREPVTPEQEKMRPAMQSILANGKLPMRIESPSTAVPPIDCGNDCIDKFIAALHKLDVYPETSAVHRIFGPLTADEYKRMSLVHCAHHLSHLIPIAST